MRDNTALEEAAAITELGVGEALISCTLDLPILAYLRETQVYVNAAFEGKSLFDLPHHIAERELEQWEFLQEWLEKD